MKPWKACWWLCGREEDKRVRVVGILAAGRFVVVSVIIIDIGGLAGSSILDVVLSVFEGWKS